MTEYLREAQIFKGLTDDQLKKIAKHGEERRVAEDDLVFKEGDTGNEVFVVVEGRVQISMEMDMPTEQAPVHTVTPGGIFGEFALVADHERSASARSSKDTTVFALSREAFHDLAEDDPKLGYTVLRELGEILVSRLIKTTRELRASLMF